MQTSICTHTHKHTGLHSVLAARLIPSPYEIKSNLFLQCCLFCGVVCSALLFVLQCCLFYGVVCWDIVCVCVSVCVCCGVVCFRVVCFTLLCVGGSRVCVYLCVCVCVCVCLNYIQSEPQHQF